jgi:hypothetical protein
MTRLKIGEAMPNDAKATPVAFSRLPPKRTVSPDDFQSPPWILDALYDAIPRDWVVWEPCAGEGNLVRAFEAHGYEVIGTDILTGQDFLSWKPPHFDVIVTNPPFSRKNAVIRRCVDLGKPWALLLPPNALESQQRQELFAGGGLDLITLPRRVVFKTPGGKEGKDSSPWQASAWFTSGLCLPPCNGTLRFWGIGSPQGDLFEVNNAA